MAALPIPISMSDLRAHRNTAIAAGVVLLHVGALWALQSGLLRRAVEVVVPVEVLAQIVQPPPPPPPQVERPAPPPPPQPRPAPPRPAPAPPRPVERALPPAPQPLAVPAPAPAPVAPPAVVPAPPAPAVIAAPAPAPSAPPAPPAPAAGPAVELPSSNAAHLNNPKPGYPPASRRLGEQGVVVLAVLISADGQVVQARVDKSSGFERLDRAALNAVQQWRFIPGKRNGVPAEMWHQQPVNFVLE